MNRSLLAAVLCLASGLCSCSSLSVSDDYDRAVDFAALKTWSWFVAKPESAQDEITSLLASRIRSAIEHELTTKGCPRVESGGDFEVSFHTVVQQRMEASGTSGYGYGWRYGHVSAYGGPDIYTYDEGTLMVDFIDPKSKHMVWRGTAIGVVDRQASSEAREQRVKDAVQKILALYPPQSKA